MVDQITSSIYAIPFSLRDCSANGEVDVYRYWIRKRQNEER